MEARATAVIPISKVRKVRHKEVGDLHSWYTEELKFELKESGYRKGCVHKGRSTQTEMCNDTHIGPAISPVPSPRLIEVQTWKWQRQRKHLGEHAGTFELGFHGITSQPSDFCHAHNLYHDFKVVGTAVYLLKVYR